MGKNIGTRVNLTLPPEVVAVLDRIGAVTSVGRASFIREMLIDSIPVLDVLARSLEQAQEQNLDAFKTLSKAIDGMTATTSQMSLEIKRHHRGMVRRKKKST